VPSPLLKPLEPDREPPANLADNLLRDFEERWWKLCKEVRRAPSTAAPQACDLACMCQQRPPAAALVRQGDEAALRKLLASSGRVLAHVVDENRRRWAPAVRMNELQPSGSRLWLFTGWQRNSLHISGLDVDLSSSSRAAVSSRPVRPRSALHYVAGSGNVACTKLLCEAGADLNLGEKDGALHLCSTLASGGRDVHAASQAVPQIV